MKNESITKALAEYRRNLLIEGIFCEPVSSKSKERLRYRLKHGNWTAEEMPRIKLFFQKRQTPTELIDVAHVGSLVDALIDGYKLEGITHNYAYAIGILQAKYESLLRDHKVLQSKANPLQ